MQIMVFTTGGTIGSAFDGTAVDVCADRRCAVAERYAAEHNGIQFDVRSPLNILSERVACDDLNTLAKAVFEEEFDRCEGVIFTVGSDNLAYLSGFVSLLFGERGVPLCFVASDKVLSDESANGYANFCCAIELIAQGRKGAFVPYRNSDGRMVVHSAYDIRQADLSDDFCSFHGAYGIYENGVLCEINPYFKQSVPDLFNKAHLPCVSENVLMIHPHPLQDYVRLNAKGARAVLHTLYHSGTLDSKRVLRWTATLGEVPVFLASLRRGRAIYASTAEAIRAGAIPLYDISPECAYMKLLLACAQDKLGVREFMEER